MNMLESMLSRMRRQRYFREIDGGKAGAVVAVLNKLLRNLDSYIFLSLHCADPYMGSEDAVVELA